MSKTESRAERSTDAIESVPKRSCAERWGPTSQSVSQNNRTKSSKQKGQGWTKHREYETFPPNSQARFRAIYKKGGPEKERGGVASPIHQQQGDRIV